MEKKNYIKTRIAARERSTDVMKNLIVMIAVITLMLATAVPTSLAVTAATGTTYYVASTGDDVAGDGTVSSPFKSVQTAVAAAADGDSVYLMDKIVAVSSIKITKKLTLTGSPVDGKIERGYKGTLLHISGGGDVTMENITLDGKNISSSGDAVYIEGGKFTIESGLITSNIDFNGGGASVDNDEGTLIMNGGKITKCIGTSYGAVENKADSVFIMNGGEISGNATPSKGGSRGGGVENRGSFTMNGGKIIDNTAKTEGGGIYNAGLLKMIDGEISGNISGTEGGGVYNAGEVEMIGGEISENTANTSGGGVYAENSAGTLSISGRAIIKDNKVNGAQNNVYLPEGKYIKGLEALTGEIGVILETVTGKAIEGGFPPIYLFKSSDVKKVSSDREKYAAKLYGNLNEIHIEKEDPISDVAQDKSDTPQEKHKVPSTGDNAAIEAVILGTLITLLIMATMRKSIS